MSRMRELLERRRALIDRCDEQRAEIAYRVGQIRPSRQVANWTSRAPMLAANAVNHPLAWAAAAAGLLFMMRPRRLFSWMTLATGAMSLLSRAGMLLRLFNQLRALRSGFR